MARYVQLLDADAIQWRPLTSSEVVILESHPAMGSFQIEITPWLINADKYYIVRVKIRHSPYLLLQMPRVALKYGMVNF